MFQLTNVSYKNILAIPSLTIPQGQITCIVGESGGGKTTLLRLLNQLTSHDRGEILFAGRDVLELSPVELRRQVMMLPQVPFIYPGTVLDNLQAGFRLTRHPLAADEEAVQALQLVHLNKDLGTLATRLSGGEKQRLALARVILMNPQVYLLDEPSAALDEDTEDWVIGDLTRRVKDTGKTLVMVTHSKRLARQYGDVVIEISQGQIVQGGEQEWKE